MVLGGYVRYDDKGLAKTASERRDEQEWSEMAMIYTAKAKHQYKLIPPEKVTNYYSMYAHADICLVPLVNSFFNRMKSNLKVLEAANLALPVIASDVHPYKDLPIRYCKHPNDWIKNIAELIKVPQQRDDEGLALHEFCNEHFNFSKINDERRQIFEHAKTMA
jgi:glycosyltransferase involved in cell wall biosynthesis